MDYGALIVAFVGSSAFGVIVNALIAWRLDKKRQKREAQALSVSILDAHGKALLGLLYGELERKCSAYLKKGRISAAELNDLRKYYYEPYHNGLGGDGTIEKLFNRVENLPVE